MSFKVGEVVQLKSGGPAMTVVEASEPVGCVWYAEEEEQFRRDSFPAACLDVIDFEDEDEDDEDEEEDED